MAVKNTTRRKAKSKKPSRKVLKQKERVRKLEQRKKDNEVKNRKRVRNGKAEVDDEVIKPTIWEKMAEDKLYHQLRLMGDSTKAIDKFQRARVVMSLFIFLIFAGVGLFFYKPLILIGPILGFLYYKMQSKRVNTFYKGWKFERQLNFSKFTRLVIPYLKASGGNTALYTIFNKILKRLDSDADRKSLYRLMGEMGDNPTDLQPFLDYAERSSGTDMSYLFMSTIFDFQQSTFDTSVIDELGSMASEDMMNSIDEIIDFKLRRFVMFPTKIVMSSFILVVGLGAGIMLDNFKEVGISGDMISPPATEQTQEQNPDKDSSDENLEEKAPESE